MTCGEILLKNRGAENPNPNPSLFPSNLTPVVTTSFLQDVGWNLANLDLLHWSKTYCLADMTVTK